MNKPFLPDTKTYIRPPDPSRFVAQSRGLWDVETASGLAYEVYQVMQGQVVVAEVRDRDDLDLAFDGEFSHHHLGTAWRSDWPQPSWYSYGYTDCDDGVYTPTWGAGRKQPFDRSMFDEPGQWNARGGGYHESEYLDGPVQTVEEALSWIIAVYERRLATESKKMLSA